MRTIEKGFGGCQKGSRKEQLAKVFAKQGRKAAREKAEELGIADSSLRVWMWTWRKAGLGKS